MRLLLPAVPVAALRSDERRRTLRLAATLVVALVVTAGFAGCASTPAPLTAASVAGAPPALDLKGVTPEVKMPGDGFGAEPNIAVLPDGTIFIEAPSDGAFGPNMMQESADLWRSTDHGATFTRLRGPAPVAGFSNFFSGDSDVATGPDGWVYASDWWIGPPYVAGAQNFMVEASGDGGKTWSSTPITTPDAFDGVDRQWLVAEDKGHVVLAYAYYHPVRNAVQLDVPARNDYVMSLDAVVSDDHGKTWSMPIPVTIPQSGHEMLHGKPTRFPDGTLLMPYADASNNYLDDPSTIRVAISHDGGLHWAQRAVAPIQENTGGLWAVQAATDDDGVAYVVWSERIDQDIVLKMATSTDGGNRWSEPALVAQHGLHMLPWIAARGNGTLAVGWYGNWTAQGDPEKVSSSTAWDAMLATSKDGGKTFQYGRASQTPVKMGPLCPKGAQCGTNRELLDYVSLAFDKDGRLHYAFARSVDPKKFQANVYYAGLSPS